jgi:serine protease AprX
MRSLSARLARLGAAVAATTALIAGATVGSAPAGADTTEMVIVTSPVGTNVVAEILSVGGTVLQQYHVVNGVEAVIPVTSAALLAALPGTVVTPDVTVGVQGGYSSSAHTPSGAFAQQTGADQLAASGDTGQGATVAVLDTGIDNLPDFAGRLIGGVDLTNERNPYQDDYGHGTFVAGLIAGNGASSNGRYYGEAPGAKLVAVKVATGDGSSHLGTLLQGVQWVVDNAATYHINVLNMSLGYQPTQSTVTNPLDQAVEKAWGSGIAVVTSAGNAGPFNGTILSPGDDPLAITVGALDDLAQTTVGNDLMNDFSSAGPTSPDGWVKPDLVSSGRSVVSVAAPGSTVYNQNPSARIGSGNFVGSGTSFASAITSGAAALVLADNPGLTPNQVKARLLDTTNPGPVGNPFVDGHGALNAAAAATSGSLNFAQSAANLSATPNGATVSLAPTRSVDSWNTSLWSGASWNGASWNGASWNGASWNGASWNGASWNGASWNGASWNGASWNGASWNGASWNGASWNGASWNGSSWNGASWNGASWNGSSWS